PLTLRSTLFLYTTLFRSTESFWAALLASPPGITKYSFPSATRKHLRAVCLYSAIPSTKQGVVDKSSLAWATYRDGLDNMVFVISDFSSSERLPSAIVRVEDFL